MNPLIASSVRDRIAWNRIRYASVWEDADILCEALRPIAGGGRLLSVASAGDNALALLTLDPAEVVALDLSPAQLACLELRIAAFRSLEDTLLPGFLGAAPLPLETTRLDLYDRAVRPALPPAIRRFWDDRRKLITRGAIHVGRFERYLRLFGTKILRLIHSKRTIDELVAPKLREERIRFYYEVWDNRRWRALFRIFFGRGMMARLGRDPAQFAEVEGSVADRILGRTRYALTELDPETNPYLRYILTGAFAPLALPVYLRPGVIPVVRSRIGRIRTKVGGVEDAGGRFDGFNLSDVFEYMDEAEHERVYGALLGCARPQARLIYWNLLVQRSAPAAHAARIRPLDGLAKRLHAEDRAWFYSDMVVEEVA